MDGCGLRSPDERQRSLSLTSRRPDLIYSLQVDNWQASTYRLTRMHFGQRTPRLSMCGAGALIANAISG